MTSSDITITHHLTGKGTGRLTAGQQQQLSALVPADSTTSTRTEDGGTFTVAKWTWTATWTAEQDQAWRAAQQPDAVLPAADWAAHLTDFDAVDTRPAPPTDAAIPTQRDHERFIEWAARQLGTSPEDVKHHFYVTDEDGRFALVARENPGDIADGTSIARELWKIARDGADPEGHLATNLLAKRHHKPTTPTMADGKTARCQAVSDGTHGYIDGSQCRRVANHSTLRNIVGHDYKRAGKTGQS